MQTNRVLKDKLAGKLMLWVTVCAGLLVFLMAVGLYYRSRPILAVKSLRHLLFSTSWRPSSGEFGFLPFIMGSLWVTGVAVVIAVPLCLLTTIYLAEYAPRYVREWTKPLIDLLAGIPSVIFGDWGILVIVPLIKNYIAPLFGTFSSGYSILAGSIVLAVMVFPIIIHVSLEVVRSVPNELREASLSLGATKWQTVKHVVIRKAKPGIIAAVVLGLSRAFGETMAVLMVAGNVAKVPSSVLDPAYPLPALIANSYGEMLSVPLYDSALLLASLVLLLVVLVFNTAARVVLIGVERRMQ
jgi:phosphate transport system permease protein